MRDDSQKGRIYQQARRILETIRHSPDGATTDECSLVAAKYTNRISDLRDAGYNIVYERDGFGRGVYKESSEPMPPRKKLAAGAEAYLFVVGPPAQAFVSEPYATAEERDAAAAQHLEQFACDPEQFMWLNVAKTKQPGRRYKVGPLDLLVGVNA